MPRFSHHSARVDFEKLSSGAANVSFYGLITRNGMDALQAQVCGQMCRMPAAVVRVDSALVTGGAAPRCPDSGETCHHEAVALVVPPELYDLAMQLARESAAAYGVRRPVFLPEQAALAYQWAAHVAQSPPARSLPRPL